MLEVFFKGKLVLEDVIFAKVEGNKVVLRDVLGKSEELVDYHISEVDVTSEKLQLTS